MTISSETSRPPELGLAGALHRLAHDKDSQAWSQLLTDAGDDLNRLTRSLTGDPAMAEDAVQETLLLIRDNAGRFAARSADADADAKRWILGIAARICFHLLRQSRRIISRHRRGAQVLSDLAPPAVDPSATVQVAEETAILRRELAALPERYGQALALHYLSGQGYSALALHFSVPEATVRTRVNRGLKILRERLTRYGMALSITALVGLLTGLNAQTAVPVLASTAAASLLHSSAVAKTAFSATAMTILPTTATGLLMVGLLAGGILAVAAVTEGAFRAPAAISPAITSVEPGYHALFNGTDLSGWTGDATVWKAVDHAIVGTSPRSGGRNDYLVSAGRHSDFILRLDFKFIAIKEKVNSGVNYRSELRPQDSLMIGYQADIGHTYTGNIFDQDRRNRNLATRNDEDIIRIEHVGGWNSYEIRCRGPHIEQLINGHMVSSYLESDPTIPGAGLIALQLQTESGGEGQVSFRNIRIRDLTP